jgi:type III pantothenate kinase
VLLAIDVGNSTTTLGLFTGDELIDRWRLSTEPHRTSDEIALQVSGLLGLRDLRLDRHVDGVVLGSVVPTTTATYREMVERYVPVPLVVVAPGVRTGIQIRHDHPQDLGADRIVNAVAAHELFGGPAIVVDFGTATSFDAVDASGTFVGGAIAPGVSTATEALVERAARLPTVEIVAPPAAIGRSTVTALQSGIVHGFAGQVDRIVTRLAAELGPGVTTIATGGLAPAVLAACETVDHHDPSLTLKGLRMVWERNAD